MKLIQAMKQCMDLAKKADDLRSKVREFCADLTISNPTYPDQAAIVAGWMQAHHDIIVKILELRVAIQRTNLATPVTMEFQQEVITKSLAEWIHRRRDLAKLEGDMWGMLTDRGLKEQNLQTTPGGAVTEVRIRRYYDPQKRDQMRELYRSEPSVIDANLEVVNATTDVMEG